MSDDETMEPGEGRNHENFLVSMSKIGKSDGRFRLQHKNDETQVLNQPLSELMGQNVTVENLLTPVEDRTTVDSDSKATHKSQLSKDFKKSYDKSVVKNKNLRLAAPASSIQEGKLIILESLQVVGFKNVLNKKLPISNIQLPLLSSLYS